MPSPPPIVVILAVGLTKRLLPFAPRISSLAKSGWVRSLIEVQPAVTCTAQATLLTGKTPAESWESSPTAGPFARPAKSDSGSSRIALIQAEPIYRTAAQDAAERGQIVSRREAVLVVQSGGTRRDQRHAETVLRGRRQQGVRDRRHPSRPDRPNRKPNRPLPLPHLLGTRRGPALHPVDRPIRGRDPGQTARTLARLFTPPRLRPPALRPFRLRHAETRRRAGRRLRPACSTRRAGSGRPSLGRQRVRPRAMSPAPSSRTASCDVPACSMSAPDPFGEIFDPFTSRAFAVCDHQLAHVYVNDHRDGNAIGDLFRRTARNRPGRLG